MLKIKGKLTKLEALRGAAAVYVVGHHSHIFNNAAWNFLFSFGQEAVMLFFVLSGFVIYYATFVKSKTLNPKIYLVHRFRRIYPLFICALMITYFSMCLPGKWFRLEPTQVLGHLCMLQDDADLKPGVWVNTFNQNTALWSLSFEWWFYMLFMALVKMPWISGKKRKYFVFVISLVNVLAYRLLPNQASLILSYFFIWWTGVELAREYLDTRHITWQRQFPNLLMLAMICLAWATGVYMAWRNGHPLLLGIDPVLPLRHAASALLLLLFGIAWYKWRFRGFDWTLGLCVVFAPISYAIYIFHAPIIISVNSLWPQWSSPRRFVYAATTILILSYLLERLLQPKINRLFDWFLVKRPAVHTAFDNTPDSRHR